ncbi:dTDP-4-dehydrorhamnose reductase [Kribbella solani]|uniref:dTDP-4-dehydrorhamnose reductase n=1 Tax=Kribbella solani TaxID=236067 RepID=UPI0029B72F85|nr:dTDP-4-dehydrorhamnose reductase [Kribbella solani]MDX2974060.1 dTDP-4-dehydrorhamnose reductase [Kribbella solani]MDX3000833.1 dTDP-4-dehydrorhamnose reductase [Kribbella solani]
MVRWLVTGSGGRLGQELVPLLPAANTLALRRHELDVTDRSAVLDAVAGQDIVVHLAAWVNADRAETEPAAAMAVNVAGAANVAYACQVHKARMIHLSSDYVFDGKATEPYAEDAPVRPISVYGKGKAQAERVVMEQLPRSGVILRTAWLFGAYSNNFVTTMQQLAEVRDQVDVVVDQIGQPTWTRDLAERIVEVARIDAPAGIYHATNAGSASRFELARTVFAAIGQDPARVRPTTSDRFQGAARPAYSVLSHAGWQRAGLPPMRHWRTALAAAMPAIRTLRPPRALH